MSFFGVPFFGAGLFMLLISLRVVPVSNASELPWWAWLILAGMGVIFTGVGGVLVFGREWITVDNRQMRVWISKGLLIPLRSSYYELHDFNSVSISFVAGDSDTSDSYPVALESAKGLPDLVLLNVVTYGEARKQALLIGDFVGYPVRDCTTDNAQELQEQVQELQEQVQAPQAITRPQMPAGGRIELIENENELIVNTRVSKSRMASSLMACIPLIFFLIFSYRFIGILFSRGTPWIVRAFFLTFFGVFFILIPFIGFLKSLLRRGNPTQSLRISNIGMELHASQSNEKLQLSWKELFGVDYSSLDIRLQKGHPAQIDPAKIPNWVIKLAILSGSKGLVIKAADGFHYFGRGLNPEEISFLHAVLNEAMIRFRP